MSVDTAIRAPVSPSGMPAVSAAAGPEAAADRGRVLTWFALGAIVGVAIALRFGQFAHVVPDPFYDAAVRSMGQSWHNFFFGALEPGGQVGIDKTPLDLWLQVASTKLFGFSSTALRLPEAVAGVLAVPVLFDTVRRLFGRGAGLASAAVLAVLPLAVLTSRSDTMDTLMVFLLVVASWFVVRASQTRRVLPMAVAGVVLGLAFNVKLFEALLVVPALLALALLARDGPWRRLLAQFGVATVAFVAVSLSWIVAASLAGGVKPWPVGSTNGSVWNVVFSYNGTARLSAPAPASLVLIDPPGPMRLFGTGGVHFQELVGSTLAAALVIGVVALLAGAPALWRDGSVAGRLRRGGVAWVGLWLVVGIALFSHMARVHTRYVEAMSPAVAAAVGVGIAALAVAARRRAAAAWLLAGAVAVVTGLVVGLGDPPSAAAPVAVAAAAVTAVCALLLTLSDASRRSVMAPALAVAALVAVLAVPLATSLRIVDRGEQNSGTPGAIPPAQLAPLSAYLLAHQDGAKYETSVSTVMRAPALIVHDGQPVLSLTSVYALPLVSQSQLARLVGVGQLRYLIVGRARCGRFPKKSCTPAVRWAFRHGVDVSRAAGQRPGQLLRLRSRLVPRADRVSARQG